MSINALVDYLTAPAALSEPSERRSSVSSPKPETRDAPGPVVLPPSLSTAPMPVIELVRQMLDPEPARRPSAASVKARVDALVMPPPTLRTLS